MSLLFKASLAALSFACAVPACASPQIENMVRTQSSLETGAIDREKECLAEAVYHESNGEPVVGRVAVAQVILNRSNSPRFPRTLCGVVNQRGQFTYRRGRAPSDGRGWLEARAIAALVMAGRIADVTRSALYFHSVRVRPGWGSSLTPVIRIGAHVFYAQR